MHSSPLLEIGGLRFDLSTIFVIIVAGIITFIIARLSVRNLSLENPSKLQNFMEYIVDFVHNTIASTMPLHRVRVFISLGLTLLMFIFISNVLGLPFAVVTTHTEPVTWFGHSVVSEAAVQEGFAKGNEDGAHVLWFKSPTADLSVTLGLGIIVFLLSNFLGMVKNTRHYFKHYFEPHWLFFPLNLIKEIFKPVTLALRLFANIFAGEILIATIIMAGFFGIPLLVIWQGFSIFIGAIQAFLFTILTMVYISQASIHEEA